MNSISPLSFIQFLLSLFLCILLPVTPMERAEADAGGYRGRGPARGERGGRRFHYQYAGGRSGPWMNQKYSAAPEPSSGEGTRRGGYGRRGGKRAGAGAGGYRGRGPARGERGGRGIHYQNAGVQSGPWMNQNYAAAPEPSSGEGTRRGGCDRRRGKSKRGTSRPWNRHYAAVQEPWSDSGEEDRMGGYVGGGGEPESGRSGPCNQNYAVVSEPLLSGSGEETRRGGYARGGVERENLEKGRGRQGGKDGGTVGPPFRVVPDETITFDSPEPDQVPKPERLRVSEQLGPSSSCTPDTKDKILPVHRPDKGGKLAIQTCWPRANHFPVKFNPMGIIMHYNMEVKPKLPQKHDRPQKIPKSDLSMIRERLFSDGENNIFSEVPLPEETFTINIYKGEDEGNSSYDVTLTLVNKLELHNQYL